MGVQPGLVYTAVQTHPIGVRYVGCATVQIIDSLDFRALRASGRRVGDRKAAELAATKIRAKLAEGDIRPLELAQAGVRHIRVHDARHTYASLMHFIPGADRHHVEGLADAIENTGTQANATQAQPLHTSKQTDSV